MNSAADHFGKIDEFMKDLSDIPGDLRFIPQIAPKKTIGEDFNRIPMYLVDDYTCIYGNMQHEIYNQIINLLSFGSEGFSLPSVTD